MSRQWLEIYADKAAWQFEEDEKEGGNEYALERQFKELFEFEDKLKRDFEEK